MVRSSVNEQAFSFASWVLAKSMLPALLRKKKRKKGLATVLCLHRVSNERSVCWPPLPVKVFEQLCSYWSKHYHVTTFENLEADLPVVKKPILILSFDDGYADFYDFAWPVLKKFGLKANMNIVTQSAGNSHPIWTQRLNNAFDELWYKGIEREIHLKCGVALTKKTTEYQLVKANLCMFHLLCKYGSEERKYLLDEMIRDFGIEEKQTPFMNWDQIRELSREGLEIGSHTLTHDLLNTIQSKETLHNELKQSKEIVEKQLGKSIQVLAYPNGQYTEEVKKRSFETGYRFVLTVEGNFFPLSGLNEKEVLWPRVLIYHTDYYKNVLQTENFFAVLKSFLR